MDTHLTPPPTVSVVVPVYNASAYLKEAIDSILYQSFTNFELIIIDDCSTDESQEIIKSYTDKRIRFFINNENLGVTKTLNAGLRLARGKYIARMDADDVALPQRLEKQVAFLEKNPEYGLVGSYMQLIPSGKIMQVPITDESIRAAMLFYNPFVHPSVMIRRSVLDQYHLQYDETLRAAQDEDLWYRVAQYCKVANIPEVLLQYRVHDQQISTAKKRLQSESATQIKIQKIQHFMPIGPSLDLAFYARWVTPDDNIMYDVSELPQLQLWISNILKHNYHEKKLNNKFLKIHLANLTIKFFSHQNGAPSIITLAKALKIFFLIGRFPIHFIFSYFFRIIKPR